MTSYRYFKAYPTIASKKMYYIIKIYVGDNDAAPGLYYFDGSTWKFRPILLTQLRTYHNVIEISADDEDLVKINMLLELNK